MNVVNLTIDDPADTIFGEFEKALEPLTATVVTFKHDPIVLACASYRTWVVYGSRWRDLDQMNPLPEDYDMATKVRNYYRAKITWEQLKSSDPFQRPMSDFRKKLMGIIEGTHQITTKDLGILYRLPYFYAEDTAKDAVFEGYSTVELSRDNQHTGTYTFGLVSEILVSRKRYESVQFWLRSEELPVPCVVVAQKENTLLPLLQSVVRRGPIQLSARLFPKWRLGPGEEGYYQLGEVKLA